MGSCIMILSVLTDILKLWFWLQLVLINILVWKLLCVILIVLIYLLWLYLGLILKFMCGYSWRVNRKCNVMIWVESWCICMRDVVIILWVYCANRKINICILIGSNLFHPFIKSYLFWNIMRYSWMNPLNLPVYLFYYWIVLNTFLPNIPLRRIRQWRVYIFKQMSVFTDIFHFGYLYFTWFQVDNLTIKLF